MAIIKRQQQYASKFDKMRYQHRNPKRVQKLRKEDRFTKHQDQRQHRLSIDPEYSSSSADEDVITNATTRNAINSTSSPELSLSSTPWKSSSSASFVPLEGLSPSAHCDNRNDDFLSPLNFMPTRTPTTKSSRKDRRRRQRRDDGADDGDADVDHANDGADVDHAHNDVADSFRSISTQEGVGEDVSVDFHQPLDFRQELTPETENAFQMLMISWDMSDGPLDGRNERKAADKNEK